MLQSPTVILGMGIDIVRIDRIREMLDRHGDRFLRKVYTAREREEIGRRADPTELLAGRFAAKEAVFKVLGTGWGQGVRWLDVEIAREPEGPPRVTLSGEADARARALGIAVIHVSIAHDAGVAVANAVAESAVPEGGT